MLVMMKVVRALNFLYGLELMSRTSPHSLTRTHNNNNNKNTKKNLYPTNQSLNTICFLYNIRLEYHNTKNGNFPSSINYLNRQLMISAKTFNCFFYYSSDEGINKCNKTLVKPNNTKMKLLYDMIYSLTL